MPETFPPSAAAKPPSPPEPNLALGGSRAGINRLTRREREVIQLAANGYGDKQIAIALNVSRSTINTHWVRIRMKLGARNRAEVVCRLLQPQQQVEQVRTQGSADQTGAGSPAKIFAGHTGTIFYTYEWPTGRLLSSAGSSKTGAEAVLLAARSAGLKAMGLILSRESVAVLCSLRTRLSGLGLGQSLAERVALRRPESSALALGYLIETVASRNAAGEIASVSGVLLEFSGAAVDPA